MKGTAENKTPFVRISQAVLHASISGRGKSQRIEPQRWTVYGIDSDGVERVYAEHTEDEHEAWLAADPLWHAAQKALVERLFRDPATRDTLLGMIVGFALDKGDIDTAVALFRHISHETLRGLAVKKAVDGGQAILDNSGK